MDEKDQKFKNKVRSFVISSLRRASLFWPERNQAIKNARVERGKYLCNVCKTIVGRKGFIVDHIEPVMKLDSIEFNYEEFATRLFCKLSNFQVICKNCSASKTKLENEMRDYYNPNRRKRARKTKKPSE